jgi:hypothetical protein
MHILCRVWETRGTGCSELSEVKAKVKVYSLRMMDKHKNIVDKY